MAFDAIIIGGGIVGAACADELTRAGLSTLLIEANEIGGGATAAGMGHIVVMDDSEAQFSLTRYSSQLWAELADELPPQAEFTVTGTLWVAADAEEIAEVHRKLAFYNARGVAAQILDQRALEEAEPNLRKGLAGALLIPNDSVVYPPRVAAFLVRGAQVKQGLRVIGISDRTVRLSDGATLSAGIIINAAGTAATALSPEAIIQPRKGHLLITDRHPDFVHHQLVELGYLKAAHSSIADSVAFNIQPRRTGQVLIGSSRQYGAGGANIEPRMMNRMLERAAFYMPAVTRLSAIRGWTGFRAATPDNLPLIGPSTSQSDVWIAAGHEGLGITTSLATARLLADQILKRKPAIPVEPYMPSRILKPRAN